MLRNTAVWRRSRQVTNYEVDQEATCAENPQNRQDGRANHFGVATRAQVLTLKEHSGLNIDQITAITGVKRREIFNIVRRAKERGYDKDRPLQDAFFQDATRQGRPPVVTEEALQEVKKVISKTRNTRTLTLVEISRQLKRNTPLILSPMSVWRTLRLAGYRKVKPTKKPGLTDAQRKARLDWCLTHLDWSLDDWKRVLWSDETSVIYGLRRGGERCWRTVYERSDATCRRNRWKGYSEFMFWGCFSYDYKGPCHIWAKETAAEKKRAAKDLEQRNATREATCRSEWELSTAFRRKLNLRGQPKGREPVWQFTESTGKLVRKAKAGGIDWYRYSEEIVKKKLLPFAKDYDLIVQEDGAAPHIHKETQLIYNIHRIKRLLWPGNSPDLNMIEPCWWYLKRKTSLHRDFDKKPQLRKIWLQAWEELEQSQIQRWVRRIIRHIREVVQLEGGNDYREGGMDSEVDKLAKQLQTLSMDKV
ncbi:MAG TPA: transposase [Ktedonobacteraceae bacterium]|jgi:transposase|nr:transposase [Ktedonobacteraceae bacterium]